jgi:outer membrane immunogenic protein
MLKKTLGLLASAAMVLGASQMASAADLAPRYTKAAPVVDVWNWTGFYIGGHVGAGWGTSESTITGASVASVGALNFNLPFSQNSRSGFLGGAQAGYNWQSGWAVFGVQADIAGMGVEGTAPCLVILSCTNKSDWLATASGRIGAVVADRGLIYAKGGAAWMNTNGTVNFPNLGTAIPGLPNQLTSQDSTQWGWLVGMGVEYMIARNWTAFIEYDYIGFEKKNEAFNLNLGSGLPGVTVNADIQNKLSIAKVGVNYKF